MALPRIGSVRLTQGWPKGGGRPPCGVSACTTCSWHKKVERTVGAMKLMQNVVHNDLCCLQCVAIVALLCGTVAVMTLLEAPSEGWVSHMQDNRVPHHQPLDGKAQRGKKEREKKSGRRDGGGKQNDSGTSPTDRLYVHAGQTTTMGEWTKQRLIAFPFIVESDLTLTPFG